jgi:biopolymer transport protein ExbD
MPWQVRHAGSPRIVPNLTLQQIVNGLQDGLWETTDEVLVPGETRWQAIEAQPQLADVAQDLETSPPFHHPEATSLDFNALIDVCLVLLIFFILTTSYANLIQKVVPIPSPKTQGKTRTATLAEIAKTSILLGVVGDKAGNPVVHVQTQAVDVLAADGKTIDGAKLRAALQPYMRGDDRKTELLIDARDVTWETVIQIQDAARSAGIQKIHYAMPK